MRFTSEKLLAQGRIAAAALKNEQVTRVRVEGLEERASKLEAVLGRGFWGRLKWLFLGE